ncbi:MAG: endonuclease/exonuclease/phosphatase family protein [Deltaproteobacteria bacterium]|nr:endonuclease/exonuclease/phosphatase family protein [Deltaproteobacteria bacterium]
MKGFTHIIPKRADVLSSFGQTSAPSISCRFGVLVWNIHKAKRGSWASDFQHLIAGKDLVLLQEAFLRPAMLDMLQQTSHLRWDLAAGFTRRLNAIDVGVMTGCRAKPRDLFFLRSPVHEPLVRLPKMAIGTRYGLENCDRELLVLNVHAINFVRINKFKRQMRQLEKVLDSHDGPILLGGDFNTWLASRTHFLKEMTSNLHLDLATFCPDRRSRYFGQALDHVFVRGLKIISASCHYEIRSSDHQPIELVLEGDGANG